MDNFHEVCLSILNIHFQMAAWFLGRVPSLLALVFVQKFFCDFSKYSLPDGNGGVGVLCSYVPNTGKIRDK